MRDYEQKNVGQRGEGVIKLLSSMKMGLFLLLLLGAVTSIGSLIPQGEPEAFYPGHYGELLGNFIILLSLNELYSTWWFMALGFIFMINILVCSIRRIKGVNSIQGLGSILLHLSILVIFAGSLVSGLMGRSEYIEVGVGDSMDLSTRGFAGQVLSVKDFKIDYYETMEPRQYVSDLSFIAKDGKKTQQKISVNHPTKVDGLKIYQKSYGWMVKGRVDGKDKVLPFDLASGEEFTIDPNQNLKLKVVFIPDYDEPSGTLQSKTPFPNNPNLACALVKGDQLVDVQVIPEGETKDIQGYPVTFTAYRHYTGLEVKRDPGVTLVYSGFALMLLGFMIRYMAPVRPFRTE